MIYCCVKVFNLKKPGFDWKINQIFDKVYESERYLCNCYAIKCKQKFCKWSITSSKNHNKERIPNINCEMLTFWGENLI